MKKFVLLLIATTLSFFSGEPAGEVRSSQDYRSDPAVKERSGNEPAHVEGEIVVKFKKDPELKPSSLAERVLLRWPKIKANTPTLDRFNKNFDVREAKKLPLGDGRVVYKLEIGAGENVAEALGELEKDPAVQLAEPNYIYKISDTTPNDPLFYSQWGMQSASLPAAWDVTRGSSEVVVAVTDTGIDLEHPDLVENIWVNGGEIPDNGVDDDGNGYVDDVQGANIISPSSAPDDDNGHGTHVAGIIGAVTNNNEGVAGVCWNCRLMPIKWVSADGTGSLEMAVLAVNYAVENGAHIINASWGGPVSEIIEDAVNYALESDVVFVASAGNDGSTGLGYPAEIEGVITVGALDQDGNRAAFSNYGEYLDLLAPGEHIVSTYTNHPYGYYYLDGTSMAAPFVSGVAALLRSQGVGDAREIVKRILATTNDLDSPGWDSDSGFGQLDAFKAVTNQAAAATAAITNINRDDFYPDEWVPINGYAFAGGGNFSHYVIELAEGGDPNSWTTDNVNLHSGGSAEVRGGTLGEFDKGALGEGRWNIRLTVFAKDQQSVSYQVQISKNASVTVYVDQNNDTGVEDGSLEHPYRTIAAGIAGALPYDTVYVQPGTYREFVNISKRGLRLVGKSSETVAIESLLQDPGEPRGPAVYIDRWPDQTGDNSVENFTIRANCTDGILIPGPSENIEVKNNRIILTGTCSEGTTYRGICAQLWNAGVEIIGNEIRGFHSGILFSNVGNRDVRLQYNYLVGGDYAGIYFNAIEGAGADISGNIFVDNGILGIANFSFSESKIYNNFFLNNGTAILARSTSGNQIYHNNFTGNSSSGYKQVVVSNSQIVWVDALNHWGNYWNEFDGPAEGAFDENDDGIIDSPYVIDDNHQDTSPYKSRQARGSPSSKLKISSSIVYPGSVLSLITEPTEGDFGPGHPGNRIYLNWWTQPHATEAEVVSWSNHQLEFRVPEGCDLGLYDIWLSPAGANLPHYTSRVVAVVSPEDYVIPAGTQSIHLESGWNWISLNLRPANSALEVALPVDSGKVRRVLGEGGIWSASLDPSYVTLEHVLPGRMYMVYTTEPLDLTVGGYVLEPDTPISLHQGWNWFGFYPSEAMEVPTALQSLEGKYQLVLSEEGVYDPGNISGSTLTAMEPGQGYMIYMNEDAVLVYPTEGSGSSAEASQDSVVKTSKFSHIYGSIRVNGESVENGEVEVLNSSGVTVGRSETDAGGEMKICRIYGAEEVDGQTLPGLEEGEAVRLKLNGQLEKTFRFTFTDDKAVHEVTADFGSPIRDVIASYGTDEAEADFNGDRLVNGFDFSLVRRAE